MAKNSNKDNRVHIVYNVERKGAEEATELPFVMGVMSDLTGKHGTDKPLDEEKRFIGTVDEREFIKVNVGNFDDYMKAMKPRVSFQEPSIISDKKKEENFVVEITFEKMEDFSPANIAQKVDGLDVLLKARTRLSNLLNYMDGKAGAEKLIEKIIYDAKKSVDSLKNAKGITQ